MLHVRTREGTFRKRGPGGRYPESAADRAPMPGLDHHSAAFSTVRSWVRYTSNGANPPYGWRVTSLIDVSQCAEALRTRPEPPRPRTARWRRTVTVGRGAARQHGARWGWALGDMSRHHDALCYVSTMALRFRSEVRFAARPSWSRGVHSGVHTSKMRTSGRTREVELAPRNCRVRRRRGGCLR